MIRLFRKIGLSLTFTILTLLTLSSCVGRDYTPDYFGFGGEEEDKYPLPSGSQEAPPEKEEQGITISKLVVGVDGRQVEVPIPSGKILEIGTGTFIAYSETDIGQKYTATAKFKIVNEGSGAVEIEIPHQIGPFSITSNSSLKQKLAAKQFMIINVVFDPKADIVGQSGKIVEELAIGTQEFELTSVALDPVGVTTINVVDSTGEIETKDTDMITFPEIAVSAHPQRQYFECDTIKCEGDTRLTNCTTCLDMLGGNCQLLTVNKGGEPTEEVNTLCKPKPKDQTPASDINIGSTDIETSKVQKKIVEIINTGPEPLIIDSIDISEETKTKSKGEFSLNKNAIFVADSFEDVKARIFSAFESSTEVESAEFPVVLPPFDPPIITTRLFMTVAYHPSDIVGSNGIPASVGSSAKDEAVLKISSEDNERSLYLVGTTTIKEVPALQAFVKTSSGTRPIASGETLPYQGITSETYNLAIPLFMKLSGSATGSLRISSITLTGNNFEWLDTKEKIESKPDDVRCIIPVFDDEGNQTDFLQDLDPVSLNPNGFTLESGGYTVDNMPLFGCINFTRDQDALLESSTFNAEMTITAQELMPSGQIATNPDGSIKETTFSFTLFGVIDPIKGQVVLRMTQTMAGILNPQFPSISAIASKDEMDIMISEGMGTEEDRDVFIMPMILDPFDEKTVTDQEGNVISTPGDGFTAVFFPIDTRAIPVTYDDPLLPDYTSLIHDSLLPEGKQGIFTGYPNLPENYRAPALKIFTGSLSYPGPVAKPEKRPDNPSACEIVDPCTQQGQKKLGEGPTDPTKKGVCAYFYTTAGDYHKSKAFYYPTEEPPGNRRDMCQDRETPYDLEPIKGKYFLNGKMEFEHSGMLFQGPTYFHNPSGPLGPKSPMDEMLHLTFTTEMLLPLSDTKTIDRLPDKKIDIAKGEYKINLNDQSDLPQLCENNTKNRYLKGKYYSSWKYIAPLLKKDKEGTIPAGCPEEDNNFTGGMAYLTGKRLDHETGHASFVAMAKFSSNDNLTFAFKDVMLIVVLNGWFCDPLGPEEDMEGVHCFDRTFNYRDATTQYSMIK